MTQVTRYDYRVVMDILSSLDCARSLSVAIMLRTGEYAQIVSLHFNPFDYNDVDDARDSLQATELLRKCDFLPTKIDKRAVAIDSFLACEAVCKETNRRVFTSNSCAAQRYVASRKISSALGSFCADDMLKFAGWGPGITLTLRGRDATSHNKFGQKSECTQPLYDLLKPWWDSQFPNWPLVTNEYEGNKVTTVPKNAKTDRTIAVEPSLNMFFQKGLGTIIRQKLLFKGIDLNDQTRNQRLAMVGSQFGTLTTVDFSSASDTIAWAVVQDLLPFKWLQVLDVLRSPRGYLKERNTLFEYEKFSSMGNGFTFELESLIFWALALASVPEDHPHYNSISVYGDDVIIPTDCYENYIALCSFMGFTVNTTKSFSKSYYRESCGKHYWDGLDITPIYLRSSLEKSGQKMMFHNRLVELSMRTVGAGFRDLRFQAIISFLAVTSDIKNVIPYGMGDLGLTTCFSVAVPVRNRRYQRGFDVKIRIFKPLTSLKDDRAVLLVRLYDLYKKENVSADAIDLGNKIITPRAGKYCYKKTFFPDWPCLGPWI